MKILFGLLLFPSFAFCQLKQIGDTIWVNNQKFIPGDTLHLGKGSAPDGSYIYIFTQPKPLKLKSHYLGKNAPYLIYTGRQDFGYKVEKYYLPVFIAPNDKNKYTIAFIQAIETKEIIIN
ncbi:MAG: hypothetical protein ACTHML_07110 [Ginsengibacter sp.]